MASVNKVIIIGNLGRDPEVRYAPSGAAICNVAIATSRSWKDKTSGERQEETEWHRVVFYDRPINHWSMGRSSRSDDPSANRVQTTVSSVPSGLIDLKTCRRSGGPAQAFEPMRARQDRPPAHPC